MAQLTPDEALDDLHRRLEEAEETLRAIRSGEVDALVVHDQAGARVYTLEGADHAYRVLIEAMQQGAISLSETGTVLYCNRRFAQMLGTPQEKVIGARFADFLTPSHRLAFQNQLRVARTDSNQAELEIQRLDGSPLPVLLAASPLPLSDISAVCLVVTDLTAQKQHEDLQETNRRKDEFMAMLAHELRNPLAPIQNAVAILKQVGLNDSRLDYSRAIIDRQVQHLTHLVDDLLDVSRITMGKVKLEKEPVQLADLITRAVETSRPMIDARKHQLTISLPPRGVRVEADRTRLEQVLGNLLTNAAKYTDVGGKVMLITEWDRTDAVIRIRDTGIGIAQELLPHVFELFRQGDRSLARSEGGMGIGLTLVKRLVELHEGSVAAFSDGVGHGSEFVIRLPLIVGDEPEEVEQAMPPMESHPFSCRSVLIVEDNLDGAESLAMFLGLLGHSVQITHNGNDAIHVAKLTHPQVILLDIGLPGISGYEVARRLRALPGFESTILIAMTGYGQEEDRRRGRDAGFTHHLVKPVNLEALQGLLESLEVAHA